MIQSGVPKTHINTIEMVNLMQTMLEEGRICFSEDYMCIDDDPERRGKIKQQLLTQMEIFRWFVDKKTGKGRFDGKVNGQNDDLIVSLLMAKYWRNVFKKKEQSYRVKYLTGTILT